MGCIRNLGFVFAILLAMTPAHARPRGEEEWQAFSTTAMGITGDILLSPYRLRAAGHDFPLRLVTDVPAFETDQGLLPARILRVTKVMDPELLNGNRLGCRRPIRWVVVARLKDNPLPKRGKMLHMAVFAGSKMPKSEEDPGLCGTFTYTSPDIRF